MEQMLGCAEFLDGFSEFRDGVVDSETCARFEEHQRNCRSCARYARVVGRCGDLVRELPPIQPSAEFLPRLQHRIYHLEDADALAGGARTSGASLAALVIAGALALVAWTPWLRSERHAPMLVVDAAWTDPAPPVAIHGPLAPAMRGSGAELLLWTPSWGGAAPVQAAFLGGAPVP